MRAAVRFAELGIRIERVMTDRAMNYVRSHDFARGAGGDRGHPQITRPYRPQTNGKAERFNRTMLDEWPTHVYRTNGSRLAALRPWLETYNRHRPHTALGGLAPISRASTT